MMQVYERLHQVAQIYGKTATFVPKPIHGDDGSGMHGHPSIWKGGKPVFAGNEYSDLSETCSTSAASPSTPRRSTPSPTTNSCKRLVPGFEATVLLATSARNRSASCRIYVAAAGRDPTETRLSGTGFDSPGAASPPPEPALADRNAAGERFVEAFGEAARFTFRPRSR